MDDTDLIHSQADAARGILEDFGAEKAMGYLIGEKFPELSRSGRNR